MTQFAKRVVVAAALLGVSACSRTDIFSYLAVSVTPQSATLQPGQTVQLTATVTPVIPDTSFTWGLSPAGFGTVDANGLYTAPLTFPDAGFVGDGGEPNMTPQTVTVTAYLNGDPAASGAASITVNPIVAGPLATLVKISGDNQTVTVGEALPQPLVVEAEDADQIPVSGVLVTFTAPDGTTTTATTDANGDAQATPIAGTIAGIQTFTASATGVESVTFTETAQAGALAKMTATDSTNQGVVSTTLPASAELTVSFFDQYGNPIAGRSAAGAGPAGSLATVAGMPVSNAAGAELFTITLGPQVGAQLFTFADMMDSTVSATFTFTGVSAGPAALILVSGQSQTGAVGTELSNDIVVEVVDANQQPVSGVTVTWKAGTGSLSSAPPPGTLAMVPTDGTGLSSQMFRLGTVPGAETITVTVVSMNTIANSPLSITETATPGPVASLVLISGSTQTTNSGMAFPNPFVVEALDQYSNPVPGATVAFTATTGNGSVSPASGITGTNGETQTSLTAGVAGGTQVYMATSGTFSVTLTLNAIPPVVMLVPISGNGQTGQPGARLAEPLVVEALDSQGKPVVGAMITFAPPMGGSVTPTSGITNAQGEVSIAATLAGSTGTQTFTASDGTITASFVETSGTIAPVLELELVSGTPQSGTVGAALAQPLVVEVVDTVTGLPVSGVAITWSTTGTGMVNGQMITGANGQASAQVTLGTKSGPEQFVADAGAIKNSPQTFVATGVAGPATQIVLVSGGGQTTTANGTFGGAFGVEVEDANGNVVSGAKVDFSAVPGAAVGSIAPAQVTTDAAGLAQAIMTAGATAGMIQFQAQLDGTTVNVTVTETVTSPGSNHIVIVSGSGQTGTVGTLLSNPLVVAVTLNGMPVSGVTVTFAVAAGNGTVTQQTVTTGANGQAQTTVTVGSLPGIETFSASVASSDGSSPVIFTETATGNEAATLVIVSGDGQTSNPGAALAQPLVVEALDAAGQPVSGIVVTFTPPMGGAVSSGTVTTNAQGLAQVTATLGTATGAQTFTGTNGTSSVTFTETASTVTNGLVLTIVSGANQTAAIGAHLVAPLIVEVTNGGGAAVANVAITWTAPTGGSVSTGSNSTGANGQAQITGTLGLASGTEIFTASCAQCMNSPLSIPENVTAGPATQIIIVSGDGQSAGVQSALAQPLVVEVEDAHGNPISGVTVTFAPKSGGGSVASTTVTTGANGQASTLATLGSLPGAETFTATASVGSQTFTETATAAIQSISVTPQNFQLAQDASQQYTATAIYVDGAKGDITAEVTWSTGSSSIATIGASGSGGGLLDAVGAGTTTVTATLGSASGSTNVIVEPATLSSIVITPSTGSMAVGNTLQFTAEGQYSNHTISNITATCSWSSKTTGVATISNASGMNGLASGVSQGSTEITCTLNGVSASVTLTVTGSAITQLEITPQDVSQPKGTTVQYTATATYQSGAVVTVTIGATWSSGNTAFMTVQNAPATAGLATLVAVGTTYVQATYQGLTAKTAVTVTDSNVVSLSLTPPNSNLPQQETQQMECVAIYSDGTSRNVNADANWSSSATGVASVSNAISNAGLVTTISQGNATITCALGGQTATAQVMVNANIDCGLRIFQGNPNPMDLFMSNSTKVTCVAGETEDLSSGSLLATSCNFGGFGGGMPQIQILTTQSAWTTSNAAIATVGNGTSGGVVQCLSSGVVQITADFENQSNYATVTVSTATLTGLTISPGSLTLGVNTYQTLDVTGTYSDGTMIDLTTKATWASSNSTVAAVSNAAGTQGQVTGLVAGTTNVTASFDGITATPAAVTVTNATLVAVIIAPANPSVTYDPNAGGGGGGFGGGGRPNPNTVSLTATALFSDGTEQNVTTLATWSSSDANVAVVTTTVTTQGFTLDIVGTGTSVISATYAGVTGKTTLTSHL